MNLKTLLSHPPKFHTTPSGSLTSWQIGNDVLIFLASQMNRKASSLEIGAGLSTIVFALSGCTHTCVVPDSSQIKRIKKFCKDTRISLKNVTFIEEKSETALPRLIDKKFDLILVDGRHAFPTPFMDLYYAVEMTKVGGLVLIDDTLLWTGSISKQYLQSEPEWKLVQNFSKSVAFEKKAEGTNDKEWTEQSFVVKRSMLGIRKMQFFELYRLLRNRDFKIIATRVVEIVKHSIKN